jgi:hypothetical protein
VTAPASLEGGGLSVVFTRRGDRFGHAVYCMSCAAPGDGPTNTQPYLESIEGTPDDDWPASPPLKELHFESRPDGRRLALLVGMAGKSHWSASVELDPSAGRLTFDVACRLRGPAKRLGSMYHLASTDAPNPATIVAERESARLSIVAESRLIVEPISVLATCPQTVRWRYVVGTRRARRVP